MTIPATEATNPLGSAALGGMSAPTTAPDQLDENTFLTLLVAQLKYQDPLNPADSTQFLTQTAQFTSLERMTTLAEQSAQGIVLQLAFGASSLVGKTVTYTNADGDEVTGTVGSVRFDATGPVLEIGDDEISMNDVISIESGPGSTDTAPDGDDDGPTTTDPTDETSRGTDAGNHAARQPLG